MSCQANTVRVISQRNMTCFVQTSARRFYMLRENIFSICRHESVPIFLGIPIFFFIQIYGQRDLCKSGEISKCIMGGGRVTLGWIHQNLLANWLDNCSDTRASAPDLPGTGSFLLKTGTRVSFWDLNFFRLICVRPLSCLNLAEAVQAWCQHYFIPYIFYDCGEEVLKGGSLTQLVVTLGEDEHEGFHNVSQWKM